ncbi:MAG: hypothetical protein HC921_20855 [Synechococcaceae cyanobacterium SM2_3_1]|nr:hypothetical protein [Synechococcaceae cyanobacterium SM2_3_1]
MSKPTPIPLPAACDVDYKIRSEWDQGFVADLTLHNLGATVTDWELSWAFPVDGVQISNLWNGQVNQTGREVKVTNLDWNATIATDGEVDLGFQAAYSGGRVTPTEFRLNGLICNGLPATPTPSTTPPPEIPINAVQILSLTDVDGSALTIGDSLTLSAVAGNAQGQDISSQIQWANSVGEVLGSGSILVYVADEVIAETLKASVGSLQAGVSFTVSSPEVIVAAHVKVLPDEAQELVESLDLDQGELRLTDSELLPTILIGDVLIGAAGEVPPVKVSRLELEEGVWVMGVTAALPKEVIEKGSATFEQTIDWSGESGEVTIVDIPGEPFHIADQLEPKWEGFVQAGDPIQTGLKVTASADLEWTPTYTGLVKFSNETDFGIEYFDIHQTSTIALTSGLRLEGNSRWIDTFSEYRLIPKIRQIKISLGPVPIFFEITLSPLIMPEPDLLEVNRFAEVKLNYISNNYSEHITYNSQQDGGGWSYNTQASTSNLTVINNDESNFDGYFDYSFFPLITIRLFSQDSHQSGLRLFVLGTGGTSTLSIIQEDANQNQLKALIEGDAPYTFLAGVVYASTNRKIPTELSLSLIAQPYIKDNSISLALDTVSRAINTCFKQHPLSIARIECLEFVKNSVCTSADEIARVSSIIQQETVALRVLTSAGGTIQTRTEGRAPSNVSTGGLEQAEADFNEIVRELGGSPPVEREIYGQPGRVSELPDGTNVVLRRGSSWDSTEPTVEIQRNPNTKIRYED